MSSQSTKIVVPLDGSPLAEQVFAYLPQLAASGEPEIVLVQVIEAWRYAVGLDPFTMSNLMQFVQSSAEEYLGHQRQRLESLGYRVTTRVASGEAAQCILDLAQTTMADYIAMTTHGRTGFVRWALGSVAERVLQGATLPVCLVRASTASTTDRLQHLLVPLDGSTLAEQALAKAQVLAKESGAKITLLQVIQSLDEANRKMLFASEAAAEKAFARWGADAEQYLQRVATQLQKRGITTEYKVIFGDPAPTILQVAADEHADLIVMTTHGHTGLQRWLYGSVANKVLHGALCPLLLVRNSQLHTNAYGGFLSTPAL